MTLLHGKCTRTQSDKEISNAQPQHQTSVKALLSHWPQFYSFSITTAMMRSLITIRLSKCSLEFNLSKTFVLSHRTMTGSDSPHFTNSTTHNKRDKTSTFLKRVKNNTKSWKNKKCLLVKCIKIFT